jgi:hypothetical protein
MLEPPDQVRDPASWIDRQTLDRPNWNGGARWVPIEGRAATTGPVDCLGELQKQGARR